MTPAKSSKKISTKIFEPPRNRRDERGQSLVEAVLALPLLLFLFMGLFQLTAYAWGAVLSTHAVHVAARIYAVRHMDDEKLALRLAQDSADRILAKAWPPAHGRLKALSADVGECRLSLRTVLTPVWGWGWALRHRFWMNLERQAVIQDEATDARLQEDEFKQPQ